MLTIYRRHRKDCKHKREGRDHRRCLCPIWAEGLLNGVHIRKSLGVRYWQRAQELVRQWEVQDRQVETPKPMTFKEACDKYLADARERSLRETTIYQYRMLLRQLQYFAELHGVPHLDNFTIDDARRFRAWLPYKKQTGWKRVEAIRTFFRFAHENGWIQANPTDPLRPPRIIRRPIASFTREEFASILKACDIYRDKANVVRLRALVLLLRYSGLRVGDAVTLSRNRIQGDKLFLYTAKTGTPVYCPLPRFVIEALNIIPENKYPDKKYFFWTGVSTPRTAAGIWQRILKRLFILAGIRGGHAHRFRHTFSIELLLAGVPMERVSILLGHHTVRVTEKHYAPWVIARQEQLEKDLRRTWNSDESQQEADASYAEKAV